MREREVGICAGCEEISCGEEPRGLRSESSHSTSKNCKKWLNGDSLYRKRKNKLSSVLLFNLLCAARLDFLTRTGDVPNRPLCTGPSIQAPCTIPTSNQVKFVPNHPVHRIRARSANIRWQRRPQEYAIICSEPEAQVNDNAADRSAEVQGSQLCRSKGVANVQIFVHFS